MGSEQTSLIGRQLGIYQVQASLGQGGMAQVYKAYHPRLRREVAIKVILSEIADSAGFQERFEREAQMIASLEHPNIVSVYDFGEEGDLTYLVMQYVGGGTLRDQLRGKRPLEPQRAIRYATQMALALHHAHQRGIIHRDVKPQNMLVSSIDPTHLLLSDFGIAKLYYQKSEDSVLAEMPTRNVSDSALTSASQIIGTADYMSPEQASGTIVDARTDVYALGIVLYQMLVGDIPFRSTNLQGLLFQHLYTSPPPVRERNPRVSEILAQITAKALAKAPSDRFPSAEALARALEQANTSATLLASLPPSNAPTLPSTPAVWSTPVMPSPTLPDTPSTWVMPSTHAQTGSDQSATLSTSQTMPSRARATSMPNLAGSGSNSAITGTPHPHLAQRRLPLSYVLAALVVIIGLVILGLRVLPGLTSAGHTITSTSGNTHLLQAFHDQFQDNHLNWPVGTLGSGTTASTPGAGAYTVTISTNTTVFPYPQTVDLLPDTFTLTATLQQTSHSSDNVFGVAFHFTQDSDGQVNCYALVITSGGKYALYEYNNSAITTITTGNYQAGPQPHTLTVRARGSSYSFQVDHQPLQIIVGAQAPTTTWNNNDLHKGHLTLFFTGPNAGETNTSFKATDVQLSVS